MVICMICLLVQIVKVNALLRDETFKLFHNIFNSFALLFRLIQFSSKSREEFKENINNAEKGLAFLESETFSSTLLPAQIIFIQSLVKQ